MEDSPNQMARPDRQNQSGPEPDGDRREGLAGHQRQDLARGRAERHPDSDFPGPAAHRKPDHAERADRGEEQRQAA